jgi:hypothetical protein
MKEGLVSGFQEIKKHQAGEKPNVRVTRRPSCDHIDIASLSRSAKQRLLRFQDALLAYSINEPFGNEFLTTEIVQEYCEAREAVRALPEFKEYLPDVSAKLDELQSRLPADTDEEADESETKFGAECKRLFEDMKEKEREVYRLSLKIRDNRPPSCLGTIH